MFLSCQMLGGGTYIHKPAPLGALGLVGALNKMVIFRIEISPIYTSSEINI